MLCRSFVEVVLHLGWSIVWHPKGTKSGPQPGVVASSGTLGTLRTPLSRQLAGNLREPWSNLLCLVSRGCRAGDPVLLPRPACSRIVRQAAQGSPALCCVLQWRHHLAQPRCSYMVVQYNAAGPHSALPTPACVCFAPVPCSSQQCLYLYASGTATPV